MTNLEIVKNKIRQLLKFEIKQLKESKEPVGEIWGNEYIHYLENDAGEPQPDLPGGTKVYLK